MKPSIKTITVRTLVNFLLVLAVVMLVITGLNFRALSKQALEDQALSHAELVRAGLTAHMKADIMDKRDYFLEEIQQLHQINRLNVIRSNEVSNQFGRARAIEHEVDNVDAIARRAFDTMEPIFVLNEFSYKPTIRAVVPYIASPVGSLNCLACHNVAEGTVLGAVDIEMDASKYRNHSLVIISGMLIISFIFMVLILMNTKRTIQRHVQGPLDTLVDKAMDAYVKKEPVSPDQFDTEEFSNVANEINLFNSEIIAHQDLLQQKNDELIALNDEIEKTLRETVFTMGVIEEQRSKETSNHTQRVSLYSQLLARKLGLSDHDIDLIAAAAPLHDLGKIGIPDSILLKPDRLTDEEHEIMKNHTRIGYTMLSHSERDILKAGGIIALQHHEKWDGSGYPQGLKGEDIHIYGRIVALADVFDALTFRRVYKEAWEPVRVTSWLKEQRGKHFDPTLIDLFLESQDEITDITKRYPADL